MTTTVKHWLESLLLEQYLAIMESSGYDTMEKCANLTNTDLDRIGMTLPGHKMRILTHLPTSCGEIPKPIADGPAPDPPKACKPHVKTQVYDVPARARESFDASVEEDIYENIAVKEQTKSPDFTSPTLLPKLKPEKGKSLEWKADVAESTPTKRPVPQPRISVKKKPVPKPRASARKSPSPNAAHQIHTLNECVDEEVNEPYLEQTSPEPQNTAVYNVGLPPVKPPRKLSIKLRGATQTETDVDQDSSAEDNSQEIDKCDDEGLQEQSVEANAFPSGDQRSVSGPSTDQPVINLCVPKCVALDANLNEGDVNSVYLMAKDVPEQPTPVVRLSSDDLDFFENPDTTTAAPVEPMSSADFDDPIYDTGGSIFKEQVSFDTDAEIPQSLDEWDQATVRQSLMIDAKLPNVISTPDEAVASTTANAHPSEHPSETFLPQSPRDCVSKPTTVELGLELYSMPCDVNKNIVQTPTGKVPPPVACVSMVPEEEDNMLNESLYAEAKLKNQATSTQNQDPEPEPTYMPVWHMKSGEDKKLQTSKTTAIGLNDDSHASPTIEEMLPPTFAPPPLPPEAKMSLVGRALPQRPSEDKVAPPPPQRNKVSSETLKPAVSVPANDSAGMRPLPQLPSDSSCDEPRRAMPLPPVPSRPAPLVPTQQSKSAVQPMLLKRDKPPPLTIGNSRESFTDLAFDRISNKPTQHLQPLEESPQEPSTSGNLVDATSQSGPQPPSRYFNQLPDLIKTSHLDDTPPASPSVYDDIQSDDTLSDGGDWRLDSFDFKKPTKDVLKEAIKIVPAVQSKSANKSGYLFKRSSQDTVRRMGGMWTKRWVELDEAAIKYYSSRKRNVTKRIIPIASVLNIEQDIKASDSHPYQFHLITVDRIYTFAAENSDDLTWWSNMLMWGVIDSKDDFQDGGDMCAPDKQGFIKMENIKAKRYFVLKRDKLCYYNTMKDYVAGSPIAQIEMKLASVKDTGKNRIQITTPAFTKILIMDSTDELHKWKLSLEEAIAEGLGDDSVLNEVYENHSNRLCADCQASGPQWASINLCMTLCMHCAGIHRMLTLPMSKVRSLRMDFRVWKPELKQLLKKIGNDNANNFWEWHLREEDRLDADADMSTREDHIVLKYRNKRFCRLHPLNGDQTSLNEALQKAVQYSDIQETMELFFTGADILSHGPNDQTPLQIAQNAKQDLQVEFLYQNGAEGSGQMPITTSMVLDHMMIGGSMFIHHKGYLYKTGSNVKEAMQGIQKTIRGTDKTGNFDFLKRWCVLERGELAYYENEKSTAPKNKIERVEMMSITMTFDHRFEFAFELATTRHGRVFLFAADHEEDRRKWVNMLAKSIAPVSQELAAHVRDFDRAGVVYLKRGSSGNWNKCWLQRKDSNLFYHTKGLHDFEKIDLRKVKSVNFIPLSNESCHEVFEEGPIFAMSLYKDRTFTSMYIQGETCKETDTWYKLFLDLLKKSGETLDELPLTAEDVPVLVDKCINFVSLHGMRTQGIYRLNGQHSKITKLLEEFHNDARDVTLRQEERNIHDVATSLKRFFRSLDNSVLTAELYPKWLNTASIQDHSVKLQWYQYLINELPTINHCTLKKLVLHLCRVADHEADTRMGSTNIASIFGPILMRVDKDDDSGSGFATTSQEIAVFKDLLDYHMHVFEVKDQEVEHENKMEKARKRMEEAMKKTEVAASSMTEMLLPIYIHCKGSQVFTIKVAASMTAEDLLKEMLKKTKLQSDKQYSLYECICNEELERPLHPMERVLAVTLCWASWPNELCKDNIICVKENYVYANIEVVFDPHSSLFGELRFSDKKGFKKYCFEFSQMKMSYKKDSKATSHMCSWNVEDITVYIGVQQKRVPPSPWGFSFMKNDEKVQGPMFGHSICCNTKEELYRWLAAILHGQCPMGLKKSSSSSPDGAASHDDSHMHTESSVPQSSSFMAPSPSTKSKRLKSSFINKLIRR